MNQYMFHSFYKLFQAYQGWWVYHRIMKKFNPEHAKIILLPSDKWEYSYYALLYLDQMLAWQGYDAAVILAVEKEIRMVSGIFSKNILATQKITRKQAIHLMQFYCLYDFDPRFVVASLEEPEGRDGLCMAGMNGITTEQLFVSGIYGIPTYKKQDPPVYHGKDSRVIHFLEKCKRGEKNGKIHG